MKYINLTNLTSIIQNFCQNHSLINSVLVANEIDFRATPSQFYPLVNIEPVESNVEGNFISQGFVITVADIMDTVFEGEGNFRLIDGCQRIAGDIVTYLQNSEDFDASTSITFNSFEDEGTDRTAGVVFRINLVYHRDDSTCVLDDLVSLSVPMCFNLTTRTVFFNTWLMYPFMDNYEVTFDSGNSWQIMRSNTYSISSEEIAPNTIGQRLRAGVSYNNETIWNGATIPPVEEE